MWQNHTADGGSAQGICKAAFQKVRQERLGELKALCERLSKKWNAVGALNMVVEGASRVAGEGRVRYQGTVELKEEVKGAEPKVEVGQLLRVKGEGGEQDGVAGQ